MTGSPAHAGIDPSCYGHPTVYDHAGSPAHAGIDRILSLLKLMLMGFPRTRGDRPDIAQGYSVLQAVPPHTRG